MKVDLLKLFPSAVDRVARADGPGRSVVPCKPRTVEQVGVPNWCRRALYLSCERSACEALLVP
jgi:hypothetical protein